MQHKLNTGVEVQDNHSIIQNLRAASRIFKKGTFVKFYTTFGKKGTFWTNITKCSIQLLDADFSLIIFW